MKKILSLVVTLLFTTSLSSFAQGNLQFNQVKSESVSIAANATTSITVPAGKIWKIESIRQGYGSSTIYSLINGVQFSLAGYGYTSNGVIWLKAGDVFALKNTNTSIEYAYYSILEFNIVP